MIQDLIDLLDRFELFVEDLSSKFSDDDNHRWFHNYIFMSEMIKDNVRNAILEIISELRDIKEKYKEVYASKDISYHIDTAFKYCDNIKDYLREVLNLYREEQPYLKIQVQLGITFGPVKRNIKDLRGRLLILRRILGE